MDSEPNPIQFRNVDLEIESRDPIDNIISELGEEVLVLHDGRIRGLHHANLELAHDSGGGRVHYPGILYADL